MTDKRVTMQELKDMAKQSANRELTDEEIMSAVGGTGGDGLANITPLFDIGDQVQSKWGSRPGTVINMEQRYVQGVERIEWFYEVRWSIDANHPHEITYWEFEHMLIPA